MLKTKKQKLLAAAAMAIGILGVFGSSARGASILDNILKNNQVVRDVISLYNKVGNQFATQIQNYSTISQQAIDQILGEQGQFTPTETKQETERKSDSKNLLDLNIKTGTAAQATNDLAGQQVLSKEGQQGIKNIQENMKSLEESTTATSDSAWNSSQEAQSSASSQEVLKKISSQLSNQADISAAQIRMSVIQNTSAQDLKVNLAALNMAAANQLEREMGKNQAEQINKISDRVAHVNSVTRNLLMPTE